MVEMNRIDLIEDGSGGSWAEARDLHAFIGIDRGYEEWLDDTILNPSHGFIEGVDYEVYLDGSTKEYYISRIMTGDLAMMAHGEQRARETRIFEDSKEFVGNAKKLLRLNMDRFKLYQEINSQSTDEFSRGINLQLKDTSFFEQFYVAVMKIRVRGRHELDSLTKIIKGYAPVFGEVVYWLADSVMMDFVVSGGYQSPFNNESMLKEEVLKNLQVFIDNIVESKTEKTLKDGRRCDIFVRTAHLPVIIELKAHGANPKRQLLQYEKDYGTECDLIAITTSEIPTSKRHPKIKYYTLQELRTINGWVV